MNDWTTDNLTNNKRLFNCDKRQAPMTLWFFIANNITVYRQSRPITSYLSWPINQLNQSNRVKNQSLIPSTAWHNSLWLWRWLPHRLSKRQSLSTTTVLFRTTFTQMIIFNLLMKWLLVSPGGRGYFRNFGWECAAGTLEPLTFTRASWAEFCYPILE